MDLTGKLTNAGTMTVSDEMDRTGVFIDCSPDLLRAARLPMYEAVAVIEVRELEKLREELDTARGFLAASQEEQRHLHSQLTTYDNGRGGVFRFNDHVVIEMLMGVPDEKRTGRLVQVRKGKGSWGSDVLFVRLRDGSLVRFENVLVRHVGDRDFEEAFYRSNGRTPPDVPPQPPHKDDAEDVDYSCAGGEYPETGFLIENPMQPDAAPQVMRLVVTSPKG